MPRITPDANDVLVWNLNDGPTFNNTGTAGPSGNWALNGHAIAGTQGLFGPALYVPGPLAPDRCGAGGASNNVVPIPLTLSGWVFLRYYPNNYTELFEKQYFFKRLELSLFIIWNSNVKFRRWCLGFLSHYTKSKFTICKKFFKFCYTGWSLVSYWWHIRWNHINYIFKWIAM